MKRTFGTSPATMGAALVLTVALVGAGATAAFASKSTKSSAPRSAPACTAGGVVNWLNTNGNGAAGSVYYYLKFTNLSGHTCTLHGYPGVSAVNLHGGQVGAPADRTTSTAHVITLINGGTAKALLQVTNTGVYTASQCLSTTAAGLKVYAPNQTAATIIPFPIMVCSKAGKVTMHIQAVTS